MKSMESLILSMVYLGKPNWLVMIPSSWVPLSKAH